MCHWTSALTSVPVRDVHALVDIHGQIRREACGNGHAPPAELRFQAVQDFHAPVPAAHPAIVAVHMKVCASAVRSPYRSRRPGIHALAGHKSAGCVGDADAGGAARPSDP